MIKKALQEFINRVPLILRGLNLVWRAAKPWTILWSVLLLMQGIAPAALVYLTRITVNQLTDALASQSPMDAFASSWIPVTIIGFLLIFNQVLSSIVKWVRIIQSELVQDYIRNRIHNHALRLDMEFFDRPESHDLMYRASVETIDRPVILLENIGNLIQSSLTIIILAAFLAVYAPWLPLLLIGSAIPGLWVVGNFVLREHQWHVKNTINYRFLRYYDWILTDQECAAEVRLFDIGPHFQKAYQRVRAKLKTGRLKLAFDELMTELKAGIITWSGGIIGMTWMLFKMMNGYVRLGDLVLCYQSFQQGQSLLRSLLESTGQIYRSTLYLDNLFQFFALKSKIDDIADPHPVPLTITKDISFDRVTFAYPGSQRTALSKLSLTLKAGHVTAIVGHNGSGKSTLIKLLCRFYDPQSGRIMIDGIDLKKMEPDELRRQITLLFQEPVHYYTSAMENIALGSIADLRDTEKVRAAARAAGVNDIIKRLPEGYDSVLGKWFGGAELSVGEWQRLALARAFFRDAAIVVLDEPTSSMDSWAEAKWLRRFRKIVKGHTALVITHRFTTAMHADIIHVMAEGRIIESGNHKQLIAAGGSYAESWHMQMRKWTGDE